LFHQALAAGRQPELASLTILDEPELGLHPFAISLLAEMLQAASAQSQVLIASQSVTLMNQFGLDDLELTENQGERRCPVRFDVETGRLRVEE
jgi:predicted ATPase